MAVPGFGGDVEPAALRAFVRGAPRRVRAVASDLGRAEMLCRSFRVGGTRSLTAGTAGAAVPAIGARPYLAIPSNVSHLSTAGVRALVRGP